MYLWVIWKCCFLHPQRFKAKIAQFQWFPHHPVQDTVWEDVVRCVYRITEADVCHQNTGMNILFVHSDDGDGPFWEVHVPILSDHNHALSRKIVLTECDLNPSCCVNPSNNKGNHLLTNIPWRIREAVVPSASLCHVTSVTSPSHVILKPTEAALTESDLELIVWWVRIVQIKKL